MCSRRRVGRMPIITMCAPTERACSSALFRLARSVRSRSAFSSPASRRGGTLISTLNWPSSVWKSGSAMALSTSALRIAGSHFSSMRLSSISMPVSGRSNSKRASRSIDAKTSRLRRILCRYFARSSRVKLRCSTSSPIAHLLTLPPNVAYRRGSRQASAPQKAPQRGGERLRILLGHVVTALDRLAGHVAGPVPPDGQGVAVDLLHVVAGGPAEHGGTRDLPAGRNVRLLVRTVDAPPGKVVATTHTDGGRGL